MADTSQKSTPPASGSASERERFDLLRKKERMQRERREDEPSAAEAFDHDFDDLKAASSQITESEQAQQTDNGVVVPVGSLLVDEIVVRKISQDLRFEAREGYPLEPRFEIIIKYHSKEGEMADTLTVTLEEIHTQAFSEKIEVIHKRMMEAKRTSKSAEREHRVRATHIESKYKDGHVADEVHSEGKDIKEPYDYDRLIELEVKKAIDAIHTAMELARLPEKLNQA